MRPVSSSMVVGRRRNWRKKLWGEKENYLFIFYILTIVRVGGHRLIVYEDGYQICSRYKLCLIDLPNKIVQFLSSYQLFSTLNLLLLIFSAWRNTDAFYHKVPLYQLIYALVQNNIWEGLFALRVFSHVGQYILYDYFKLHRYFMY